jgi:hypothetical protein
MTTNSSTSVNAFCFRIRISYGAKLRTKTFFRRFLSYTPNNKTSPIIDPGFAI